MKVKILKVDHAAFSPKELTATKAALLKITTFNVYISEEDLNDPNKSITLTVFSANATKETIKATIRKTLNDNRDKKYQVIICHG